MNEEVNTHRGISNLEPSHQPVFESSSQPIFGHSIHDPTHGPRRPSNESKTLQLLSGQFAKDSIPSRRSEKKVQNLFATQLHQNSSTQHPRRACKNGGSSLFQPLRRCVARRGVCQGCVAGCTQWGMPWRYSGRGHRHRHLLAAQARLHGAYFALVRRLGLSMEDTSVR